MAGKVVEVTLYSCDGEEFRVPPAVASRSETVKNMLEDTGEEDAGQSPTSCAIPVTFKQRLPSSAFYQNRLQ